MRGLTKLAAATARPPAAFAVAAYSTFSGGGGGGGGRGRGRGSGPPPSQPPLPPRVLGQRDPDADDDTFAPRGIGHGRGQPAFPSSPVLPSFSSWMSSSKPSADGASAGRGRGRGQAPAPTDSADRYSEDSSAKKPIFFKKEDDVAASGAAPQFSGSSLPQSLTRNLPGTGRGKPTRTPEHDSKEAQENRHIRPRAPGDPQQRFTRGPSDQSPSQPRMRTNETTQPTGRGGRGRGRGERGMIRGRGRGRGRGGRRDAEEQEVDMGIYLGDNADGERLEKTLGEEKMKQLTAEFEEMSYEALPSMMDEAYLDALHTNNLIEYEPEYLVNFENPDIDEKPAMTLLEALEKAKPFLMAYEGIQSQEEWEEALKDIEERLPAMKELMDMYCGPNRVTAKQQQEELERVAKTLPENIPSSVKRFTDRALLSLQSNPGWGWDKKCQFMDKLVWEVSQHYK